MTPEGKKRYSKQISVESTSHKGKDYEYKHQKFTSDGTGTNNKFVDAFADKKDYKAADRWFSAAGRLGVDAYKSGGEKAVKKVLSEELKGCSYEYIINDEKYIKDGESYVTYALTVYGNKNIFRSYGEDVYSDDEEFSKR